MTSRTRLFAFGLALACLATLPGAAAAEVTGGLWQRTTTLVTAGSGTSRTEDRALAGFTAVALDGSFNVVLRQGVRDAVRVSADDNLLPLIETRVVTRDGVPTLEIGARPGASFRARRGIVVTVDVVALRAITLTGSGDVSGDALTLPALQLRLRGSGDIRLTHLDAGDLRVRVSGSGDVWLDGRANTLVVSMAGSGDVHARELQAQDATVTVAGSGDVRLNAQRTLNASIAGSGSVHHSGPATLTRALAGSGSIVKD